MKSNQEQKIILHFEDLNISSLTLNSLFDFGYKKMTSIQKLSIPWALKGNDVLGSARTGSGKTLCFVIPIIEVLWNQQWTKLDAVGACIICPIRELAIQIFDFTKNLSKNHNLEIGLLIGGNKSKKKNYSIISSTPGCLFSHLVNDKTLNLDSVKILAIDEADKILDASFWRIINLMSKFLPRKKQILLFSATLNSKIKNIARLNLKSPIYCSLNSKTYSFDKAFSYELLRDTDQIKHFVVFFKNHEKTNYLFSFLRSHKMQKIIIFFSTKKQVKFLSEIFKIICPDFIIFCTYGSMNQDKRIINFLKFNQYSKGFLFSTDLTARGLDFKSIDWIIQFDCPQTIESYIHRVGRTGRFLESGKAIMFLDYNELKFVNTLDKNFIRIHQIKFNQKQMISIQLKLEILLKKNIYLLSLAQNAFISYARFIYYQKNKKYSDFNSFNWKKIASSYGLSYSSLCN
jgi:ATP-dependent RNA helicase DDX10/DBP4